MEKKSPFCTLTDQELIEKTTELIQQLIDTGGKSWVLNIPARPNSDPDLIFTELNYRFKKLIGQLGPVWVKATERLPGWEQPVHWRIGEGRPQTEGKIPLCDLHEGIKVTDWAWLDESATFSESPAEQPVYSEQERHETRVALRLLLKLFRSNQISEQQEKHCADAEALLKKYSRGILKQPALPTFWDVAKAFKWAAEYRDERGGQLTLYNDQWTLISEDEDGNENETQDLTPGNVAELYCLQKGFEKDATLAAGREESDAVARTPVFIPCTEDDPDCCGGYTSNDGQSLCHVKEIQVPASLFKQKPGSGEKEVKPDFIEFIQNERNAISKEMLSDEWWLNIPAAKRVAVENILIAYDQMAEKLKYLNKR